MCLPRGRIDPQLYRGIDATRTARSDRATPSFGFPYGPRTTDSEQVTCGTCRFFLIPELFLVGEEPLPGYPLEGDAGLGAWRKRRYDWLVLLAATFGLWFVAAVARKYPYGASCRLAQHVAPFYCLLAGLGAATLLLRLPEHRRHHGVAAAFALLLIIAAVGIGRDLVKPYRDVESRWSRQLAEGLLERSAGGPIAVSRQLIITPPLVWYLLRANRPYGTRGDATGRVAWLDEMDAGQARRHGSVWFVEAGSSDPAWVRQKLGPGWRCVRSQGASVGIQGRRQPVVGCCLDYWVRSAEPTVARSTATAARAS